MTDTLRALDEAIQAHIAEVFPGHLTDAWVLVTHSNSLAAEDAGLHNYRMVSSADQPWHTDAGLVSAANHIVKDAWDFDGDDDE